MAATCSNPRWYLIQTKPRQEARADENLRRQSFDCYRPHKHGKTEEPLFPGYLFIRLDRQLDNWYPIRSTRGVARVVSFGGEPTPVRDELIEQLRQRLAPQAEKRQFRPGDLVQVRGGGFNELDAIFISADGEERSVILLNLLQREQRVRVPTHYLSARILETAPSV